MTSRPISISWALGARVPLASQGGDRDFSQGIAGFGDFDRVEAWLGGDGALNGRGWGRREVAAGTELGTPEPLFRKIDLAEE